MIKKIRQKRILYKNVGFLSLLQVVEYLAPLIILIYLTSTLSVDVYGKVAFVIALSQLLTIATDFGIILFGTEYISKNRSNTKKLNYFISNVYCLKLALFLLIATILIATPFFITTYANDHKLFIYGLLIVFGITFQPNWFFLGIEKMALISITGSIAKLTSIPLIIFFVLNDNNYSLVILLIGLSQCLGAIIGFFLMIASNIRLQMPSIKGITEIIRGSFSFFAARLSGMIYTTSGTVFIGIFSSPTNAAIFAIADQLYKALQSLFMPLNQALFPFMSAKKDLRTFLFFLILSVFLVITVSLIGYIFMPFIFNLIFSNDYIQSLEIINIFFLCIIVHVVNVLWGYPIATAIDKMHIVNQSTHIGAFTFILIMMFLTLTKQIIPLNVAFSMLFCEFLVFLYRLTRLVPSYIKFHDKMYKNKH